MQRSLSRLLSRPCLVASLLVPGLMAATPSPTGYWSLNTSDVAATLALDRSGNHMDATIYNAGAVTGKIGQALNFNGVDSHLLLSNEVALMQLTGDLTIATWIRTTNAVRDEAVVSKYDTTGAESGYMLKVTSSGTMALRLGLGNLASGPRETSDTTRINDGQWHHVAVVITLGQDVRFYVDGSLTSASPTVAATGITASPTVFGYSGHAAYGEYFTGSLDEVTIFRQALAAAEIQPLYSNPQDYDLTVKRTATARAL
ncbi:MAG: protein with and Laminin domain, partial [Bryobacterales bacterium]|nr:protein with and Laminin domain [Bryobacterales bacterium]